MATIQCNIVSPEGELFSGEVEMLSAEGGAGEIAITPRHAPLLTNLKPGPVKLTLEGGEEEVEVGKEVEKVEQLEDGEEDTIVIGSKVKWTDKKHNELTGLVEKITDKSYKICCKDGKKSGDKGSLYMVSKNEVSLD